MVRWTVALLVPLQHLLRQRMQQTLHAHWRIAGRCVFGVDGSKLELARTRSNAQRFAPSATQTGKPTRRSRKGSRQTDPSRRKKYDAPCGPPAIHKATRQQQQLAKQLKAGLTA